MLMMLGGTVFSAISQVLLKQSANQKYKNPIREYLNWRVILAYGIFFWRIIVKYILLHQGGYAVWTGNRYGGIRICTAVFLADLKGKDHKRENHWKYYYYYWNFYLYTAGMSLKS